MTKRSGVPFHYGWVIVATGSLVLFSCLGLARYAYTMLLPGMQASLGFSYDRMGYIGTANFVGYLVSVVIAPALIKRLRPRVTIVSGLLIIGLATLGISRVESFVPLALLYTLVGLGGGFANIPTMALVTWWFRSEQRGRAAGLVIGGNGAAIICAGFVIPLLSSAYGAQGWRHGWQLLGAVSLLIALIAALLLRNHPAEMGLEPAGRPQQVGEGQLVPREAKGDGWILARLGLLYLVFGATFMVYGTFIVTTMVKEYGFSDSRAGLYWSWVGFFSLFSGVGFGALSDRIGRKRGIALVFALQSVAYLLAGMKLGETGLLLSIILYGSAVFAIPAIMAAAIADYLGLHRAATAFATVTIFFAAGQTMGPAGAGLLARSMGGFAPAYLVAALLTLLASLFAMTLPRPKG